MGRTEHGITIGLSENVSYLSLIRNVMRLRNLILDFRVVYSRSVINNSADSCKDIAVCTAITLTNIEN